MTGRPSALSALALASTARVADSAMEPIRRDTRGRGAGSFMGPCWQKSCMSCGHVHVKSPGLPDQVRLGPLTSRMLADWVVDDDHAQACPQASRSFPNTICAPAGTVAEPHHRITARLLKGQWLNW